jgi:predicted proteasome-type protease
MIKVDFASSIGGKVAIAPYRYFEVFLQNAQIKNLKKSPHLLHLEKKVTLAMYLDKKIQMHTMTKGVVKIVLFSMTQGVHSISVYSVCIN